MSVPDVSYKVEIAWTSNWRTPAVDRVWTDVSAYVELQDGIKIDYGRSDEVSAADANTMSLTFDNKDGRFTWGNAASPYYPNVKLGRPIRVTATVGGSDYVRFVGYINEWPVEWPGESAGFATTSITASSRMARLGLDSPLQSQRVQSPLRNGAVGVWPLTDPEGSVSGANLAPTPPFGALSKGLEGAVTFGGTTGPTGVESQVPLFNGGTLRAAGAAPGGEAGYAIEFWIRPTATPAATARVALLDASAGDRGGVTVQLNTSLQPIVTFSLGSGTTASSGALSAIPLNTAQHIFIRAWRTTGTLGVVQVYRNGDLEFDSSVSMGSLTGDLELTLGSTSAAGPFVGAISDVAVYTGASVSTLAPATLAGAVGGYAGDTTDARLKRYATWVGIPAAEVTTTASTIALAGMKDESSQPLELMRQVETAEAGVLYDDRLGSLVLRPRSERYNVTPALTIALTSDRVSGFAPKVDRQNLANVGKGKNSDGTVDVTYTDESSRDDYGDASYDVETTAAGPDEPLQLIAWAVNANSQPRPRAPSVRLSVIDWIGSPELSALLGLDVSSLLRLTAAPSQAPASTDFFVEGYTEEIGVGSWAISPNLSPSRPYDTTLLLDSATRGLLDTNVIAL